MLKKIKSVLDYIALTIEFFVREMLALLGAAIVYYINAFWCFLTGWFRPHAPERPQHYSQIYTSPQFSTHEMGDCGKGTYIKIYIPDNPYRGDNNDEPCRSIVYLHGFSLGPPEIYQAHLEHLVKQGYYVFYPVFQKGFCKFDRCFLKTVKDLIDAAAGSGIDPQEDWLNAAIASVKGAYNSYLPKDISVETYLFGHSLGGLFALSWAHFINQENTDGSLEKLLPKQVVVADPIPSTKMGISGPVGKAIKLTTRDDRYIDIQGVGGDLTMPVAILHGDKDAIAPKGEWKQWFPYIKTEDKKMYLSFSDIVGCPPMYANHEQATQNLSFFPIFLQLTFLDGVGVENNLNWRYIWDALDRVVRYGENASQLTFDMGNWSNGESVRGISVFLPELQ